MEAGGIGTAAVPGVSRGQGDPGRDCVPPSPQRSRKEGGSPEAAPEPEVSFA